MERVIKESDNRGRNDRVRAGITGREKREGQPITKIFNAMCPSF
jgi:hypothetical protein